MYFLICKNTKNLIFVKRNIILTLMTLSAKKREYMILVLNRVKCNNLFPFMKLCSEFFVSSEMGS